MKLHWASWESATRTYCGLPITAGNGSTTKLTSVDCVSCRKQAILHGHMEDPQLQQDYRSGVQEGSK